MDLHRECQHIRDAQDRAGQSGRGQATPKGGDGQRTRDAQHDMNTCMTPRMRRSDRAAVSCLPRGGDGQRTRDAPHARHRGRRRRRLTKTPLSPSSASSSDTARQGATGEQGGEAAPPAGPDWDPGTPQVADAPPEKWGVDTAGATILLRPAAACDPGASLVTPSTHLNPLGTAARAYGPPGLAGRGVRMGVKDALRLATDAGDTDDGTWSLLEAWEDPSAVRTTPRSAEPTDEKPASTDPAGMARSLPLEATRRPLTDWPAHRRSRVRARAGEGYVPRSAGRRRELASKPSHAQ